MDLQKSYEIGFRKKAESMGVNPHALVKLAEGGFFDSIMDKYHSLDPRTRRAVIGGLLSGLGTYALSDWNNPGNAIAKSVAGGLAGGLATYGLDRIGVLDKILPYRRRELT